jgi:hypothetical protein
MRSTAARSKATNANTMPINASPVWSKTADAISRIKFVISKIQPDISYTRKIIDNTQNNTIMTGRDS